MYVHAHARKHTGLLQQLHSLHYAVRSAILLTKQVHMLREAEMVKFVKKPKEYE